MIKLKIKIPRVIFDCGERDALTEVSIGVVIPVGSNHVFDKKGREASKPNILNNGE
jgi:hypothetical protein